MPAMFIYYLWEYKRMKGCFVQKWKYVHNRDEFIRKFNIKYPQITDKEISNFIRIYLRYELAENNHEKSDLFLMTEFCFSDFVGWFFTCKKKETISTAG